MSEIIAILAYLVLGTLCSLFITKFAPGYFKEKGKNLATKEDIGDITKNIESVKTEIAKIGRADEAKYKLKHDAYLEALTFIDAEFSHRLLDSDNKKPTLQYSTAEKARAVHNNLILSSDSEEVVKLFLEMLFNTSNEGGTNTNLLNDFRNLIRKELGFGEELALNRDKAWVSRIVSEKPINQT